MSEERADQPVSFGLGAGESGAGLAADGGRAGRRASLPSPQQEVHTR